MIEIRGNIFDQTDADAICFTSNGMVDRNNCNVMGAGIANQFRNRYPGLSMAVGNAINKSGNHVHLIASIHGPHVISFPTKDHWRDDSSIDLIIRSSKELVGLANAIPLWKKVVLPRPGCGLGGLNWQDVKKVIEPILDDRFYIIDL